MASVRNISTTWWDLDCDMEDGQMAARIGHGKGTPKTRRRKEPDPAEFEDTCLPREGYHVSGCHHQLRSHLDSV